MVLEDPTDTKMKDPIVTALSPTHALSPLFRADFIETVLQVGSDERPSFLETVFMPPKVDLQEKNRLRGLGKENGGRASAVWITGEDAGWTKDSGIEYVDAPSGREDYVRELVKVMDIDIYGPCMNNTAWPVHADNQTPFTAQEIMTDYKFVFALERVNCEDYVTRSLKDALTVGAVLIVDGPQDYSRFAPSANAVVQINSFISPEQLAKEIDILDRNDTLYSKPLSYRVGSSSTEGISPLFRQTFGTIKSEAGQQAPAAPASAVTIAAAASWAPDRHGAYCGICQLAHELAQNTYDWTAHTLQQNEKLNKNAACESLPRYLPGLPAQMQAYDAYLQNENNQAHLRQQQEMDRLQQQQQQQLGDHHQPTFDRETGEGNTLPLSEVHYLLLLILALFVGVGALVLILPKSARQKLLWPWRHLFYKKLPHNDRDALTLERIMLRELGEDLLYD
ncbi:Alpha-(1,3)-fucosyltransferase 11 [Mortierella sp. NVP41]|nr:Alpha-(1,3)-fucosyltransferase 11 [Mortierella sp. NVP41]